jgi:hypothetical protein
MAVGTGGTAMNKRASTHRGHTRLAEVIAELRDEGWSVEIEPKAMNLPHPLQDLQLDFIARRGGEILVGEVASRTSAVKEKLDAIARRVEVIPNAKFEVFWLGDTPQDEPRLTDIRALAREASIIAERVGPTPALLVAWAALEGAIARYASTEEEGPERPHTPRQQLASLYSRGLISQNDFDRLSSLWRLRSEIAHRASRIEPSADDIEFVLALADRMATDKYVSTDEIVEWYLSTHGDGSNDSQSIRDVLKRQFPYATEGDLARAIQLLGAAE